MSHHRTSLDCSLDLVRRVTSSGRISGRAKPSLTLLTDVGKVTETTMPFSKDSWLFAIRAVDAQGHRGVPVFPLPLR